MREDKEREAGAGFDGTWVAHPDLVPVALREFDRVLGDRPNQVERLREDVDVAATDLLDAAAPGGDDHRGRACARNVSVGIRYLEAWLRGIGAVAIHNLMEDAATAEIAAPRSGSGSATARARRRARRRRRALRASSDAALAGDRARARCDERATPVRPRLALADDFDGVPDPAGLRRTWSRRSMTGTHESRCEGARAPLGHDSALGRDRRALLGRADVVRLRGSVHVEHTLARRGAERLW